MAEILSIVGKIAGIGGIVLGVFLLLFKEVIRKNIFASLTKSQSYRIVRLFLLLVWSIAILGIAAWTATEVFLKPAPLEVSKSPIPVMPIQTPTLSPPPELPGNTGWLLLGMYDASNLAFDAEGPHFSFVKPKSRRPYFPAKGDVIRLTKQGRVMMKNYLPDRTTAYAMELICRDYDEDRDDTGVRLQVGTEVVIRDIGKGCQDSSQPDNWAALWVRIGYPAK